jgi:hypothetical protein
MSEPVSIEKLFGAFVNQGTIEEAAAWMASLAKGDCELADEFDRVLTCSIEASARGETSVVEAVNRSGYRVNTPQEACEYCVELLNAYRRFAVETPNRSFKRTPDGAA